MTNESRETEIRWIKIKKEWRFSDQWTKWEAVVY